VENRRLNECNELNGRDNVLAIQVDGSRWRVVISEDCDRIFSFDMETGVLRITIELWPGGRETGKRVIASGDIGRIRAGELADYEVDLREDLLGDVGDTAQVRNYPRRSSSVWDLVARCISAALNDGREELPPRPTLPDVPVHVRDDGVRYVRLDEIPEPARSLFRHNLAGSGIPSHGCAYAHDWTDFLFGGR